MPEIEIMYDGESISTVARRNGLVPNLLYCWRKIMFEGGSIAMAKDDSALRQPPNFVHTIGRSSCASMGSRYR